MYSIWCSKVTKKNYKIHHIVANIMKISEDHGMDLIGLKRVRISEISLCFWNILNFKILVHLIIIHGLMFIMFFSPWKYFHSMYFFYIFSDFLDFYDIPGTPCGQFSNQMSQTLGLSLLPHKCFNSSISILTELITATSFSKPSPSHVITPRRGTNYTAYHLL